MKHHSSQSGFTLVELMVSLSLFIIVVLALVASLYTVNDASRRVQAMRTVMDNLNFAMESMSRNIRTSEKIVCGSEFRNTGDPNCRIKPISAGPNEIISMRSTLGKRQVVEYRLNNGAIEKRNTGFVTSINDITSETPDVPRDSDWIAITSPEITIDSFSFYVDGASYTADTNQPSVIVKIEGVASVPGGTSVPFAVQTLLSQRTPEPIVGT